MICNGCNKEFVPRHNKDYRCQECYSKQGRRNKNKGRASERDVSKGIEVIIKRYGLDYRVRRVPASGAIHEISPGDIMFLNIPNNSIFKEFHWEVKNTSSFMIPQWFSKAKDIEKELGTNKNPVIISKKPNEHIRFATIEWELFIKLLSEIEILRKELK